MRVCILVSQMKIQARHENGHEALIASWITC